MGCNKYKNLLLVAALILLIVILLFIFFVGRSGEEREQTIGMVLSGSAQENGWNGMNYEGAKAACTKLGVNLLVKDNVAEYSGQCEEAVRELAEEGAGMILLTSYGYSEEVRDIVKEYPDVVFNVNFFENQDEQINTYFVRMYQARYLSGIIAGMRTQSNVVGYVAAMPNNEVNRGINAFTLGVRQGNPDAKVVVLWTGAWDDGQKETAAVEKLVQECFADVVTYHQNQGNVVEAAERLGVDSIGYHREFEGYSPHYLTSIVCDWGKIYEEVISEYLKGRGNEAYSYWIGLEADVVGLAPYSELVTGDIQAHVEEAREHILSGGGVFSGKIYDREGNLICGESETVSDEALLEHVDWYVEGVEFYEESVD